jgi:hypothetical protein
LLVIINLCVGERNGWIKKYAEESREGRWNFWLVGLKNRRAIQERREKCRYSFQAIKNFQIQMNTLSQTPLCIEFQTL